MERVSEAHILTLLQKARAKYPDSAKKDVILALRNFPDLSPDCDLFTYPDGTRQTAFRCKGTIPVMYKGVSYNIPISLYLWDTHPYYAPICFVCPTPDMVVKESQTVDRTGKIYLPYLNEWRFPGYDLNGLLQVMAISFQETCPVFAKPPSMTGTVTHPTPATPSTFPPYPTTTPTAMPSPFGQYSQPYPTHYPTTTTPSAAASGTLSPEHVRASLLSAVEDRFRQRLREKFGTVQAELASIRQTQQELRTGHDKLKRMLEELDNEQRAIDTASLLYQEKKLELQRVLESTRGGDDALGVDGVIEPQFPLHRQLLANYVADCAIDDAVYFLGQALKKNAISLQEYLNQVRQLSRRQFIHRATMQKCRVKARLPV